MKYLSLASFYACLLFIMSCNTSVDHQAVKDDFVISSWMSVPKDFDSLEWDIKLDSLKSLGITELLVGGGPESLRRLMPLAQSKSMKLHAWMWTLNSPNDSVAMKHPDWYSVNKLGQNSLENRAYVNYYQWLSPFHPKAREHIKSKVRRYLEIPSIASVHLDYVRFVDVILGADLQPKYGIEQLNEYPEYDYGYHPIARDSFERLFGIDPIDFTHPELSNEWRQFRMNAVTSLVNEIAEMTHNKNVALSAAVFPFPEMSRNMVRQNWSAWDLDRAYPMVYQNFYKQDIPWIGFCVEQAVDECEFPIYAGLYMPALLEENELAKAIQLCKEKGASGVSLFTANNLNDFQKRSLRNIDY